MSSTEISSDKVDSPELALALGQKVKIKITELDIEKRRVSLGLKQCKENPWLTFSEKNSLGDVVKGEVRSITDFGIFVGLDGGIDGLIHITDITSEDKQEEAIRSYKKGDDVKSIILSIDSERERVSLGIKQLQDDQAS